MQDDLIGPNAAVQDAVHVRSRRAAVLSGLVIAILFALQMADGIDQVALSFTAPFMRKELGLSFEALGAAFTTGYIGSAFGAVIFGTLAGALVIGCEVARRRRLVSDCYSLMRGPRMAAQLPECAEGGHSRVS